MINYIKLFINYDYPQLYQTNIISHRLKRFTRIVFKNSNEICENLFNLRQKKYVYLLCG